MNANLSGIDAGLLRFCLQHSDGGSGGTSAPPPQRDPADYAWLRAALNDLKTDADRMKELTHVIRSTEAAEQTRAACLEELECLVEDLDNANGSPIPLYFLYFYLNFFL